MNHHDLPSYALSQEQLLQRLEGLSRGIIADRNMTVRGFVPRCGRGRCSLPLYLDKPRNGLLHFGNVRQEFGDTIKKAG